MGRSVPRGVQVNLATAYSQLGEFRQAVDIYETALGGANDGERGQILLNLALAYRRLGDLSAATRSADEARSLLARSTEREHHLELELIQARIDADSDAPDRGVNRLNAACRLFDAQLSDRLR